MVPRTTWIRILVPLLLILLWLGLGAVGGPIFGKIAEVSTNDPAAFLPANAESTQVQQLQSKFTNGQAIPALVVIEFDDPINPSDIPAYGSMTDKLKVDGVQQVIGPIPSNDLAALEFIAPISNEAELKVVIEDLRRAATADLPTGARAFVTGPAGLSADLSKAFGGIDGILLVVALSAVFVILLLVYRSLLLPVLVLINSVFALCAAILVVYLLAKNGVIELNGQSQGILSILVIGAATDYSLLLVARYREALGLTSDKWEAVKRGIKGSIEPIIASAATVILALLCLLFSDLNSNKSLGPIAATGIVFSLLATLTFLPALLAVFGKAVFWPSKVKVDPTHEETQIATGHEELTGIWKRTGSIISRHARATWIVLVVILSVASLGLFRLQASGVPQTELVLTQSDSADGQQAIARHFSAGAGAPVVIAADPDNKQPVVSLLRTNKSVAEVTAYGPRGQTNDLDQARVVNDKILLSATLNVDPYSTEAETIIQSLRGSLGKIPGTLVGGTTAIAADTSDTAQSDLIKIVPLVLVVIYIVLAVLLRALFAPLLLILTVVLSFGATLGIAAVVFNDILNFPGADATVPLFGFVFLVALGVDYNIFLISRTREETIKYGTRAAVLHSLGKTGGVITSAGIVLAATFAALGIIPILFLVQIAFIVAFGVLLDTFLVRSLLVPALFTDIGSRVWWPSQLAKVSSSVRSGSPSRSWRRRP